MADRSNPTKVAIKYCGCCNPHVELSKIAHHLVDMAETDADLTLIPFSENTIDIVVILCGCPRACGNKEEVKERAKHHLLVTGENIDGKAVHEENLPQALHYELEAILGQISA